MQLESLALLNDVAFKIGTLREAKKRFSDRLAPEFSIFEYLHADEMALSRCLAGLLDPQGKHGQGNVFLRSFFESVCPKTTWIRTIDRCEVATEKQANGQRRIDVLLSFEDGYVGIENKPWAADQKNQLIDYADYLKKLASSRRKQWLLIYLCNNEPSIDSILKVDRKKLIDSGHLISINYLELIDWLEICRTKAKALNVQIFIEELIKFIRINVNGELEMTEEKETCATILSSKETLSSAFQIFKSIDEVKRELMIKFHSELKSELDKLNYHLVWNHNLEINRDRYVGFGVKFHLEQDVYLAFEFGNTGLNGLDWGIRREKETVPDSERWKDIQNIMESHEFGLGKENPLWPWYTSDTKIGLGVEIRDWNKNDLPWKLIMGSGDDGLAKIVTNLATRVRNAFVENPSLLGASCYLKP